jgi:voltage-dependent calcium channel
MSWIVVIFLSGWLLFGNCASPSPPPLSIKPNVGARLVILIQLFIAVINENFDVAEEKKREQQVAEHFSNSQTTAGRFAWVSRLNPYKYTKSNPKAIVVESLPSNLVLPMQKAIIQDKRHRRQEVESSDVGDFMRTV